MVLHLGKTCIPGTNTYFDRYFTWSVLLDLLAEKQILRTGIVTIDWFPNVGFECDEELLQERQRCIGVENQRW